MRPARGIAAFLGDAVLQMQLTGSLRAADRPLDHVQPSGILTAVADLTSVPPASARLAMTARLCAGNVGLLLCWPALALCVLAALGVEKLGIVHIQLEKKVRHPSAAAASLHVHAVQSGPSCCSSTSITASSLQMRGCLATMTCLLDTISDAQLSDCALGAAEDGASPGCECKDWWLSS